MIDSPFNPVGRPLSICVLTQQLGSAISGVGQHAADFVNQLVASGHRVWVIAPQDQLPPGEQGYQKIGVGKPLFADNQARWIALSVSFGRALQALQRTHTFDVIHFMDAREAFFCRTSAPVIGEVHDTYAAEVKPLGYFRAHYDDAFLRWFYYHFVKACERLSLPRLDRIIANSCYTASKLSECYGIDDQKIDVCYKSVDQKRFQQVISLRAQAAPLPRILFIGGNMQRKGLATLIRAAPAVITAIPLVEFVVVGVDRAIPKMQALCRELNVYENFHYLGWQPPSQLLNAYTQASVLVMPSLMEAFGMVFIEAMAAGVPVIGTRVGGIPEIIQDGENGLLVDHDNPDQLSQAIIRLFQDQILREHCYRNGIETASHFDVSEMIKCTSAVYSKVLANASI